MVVPSTQVPVRYQKMKFVKYLATGVLISLPIVLIYLYLRGTSWSGDDLVLVVLIILGVFASRYAMLWSGVFLSDEDAAEAQALFPDPRLERTSEKTNEKTKLQVEEEKSDLKLLVAILLIALLLPVVFDVGRGSFLDDTTSNNNVEDTTAAGMEASLESEIMDFPEE